MAKIGRILVVGGGIGGLAVAIAARRAGVQVDLLELQPSFKVYHVGIIVQGNFIRAMAALGIAAAAVKAGYPHEGLEFQDLHGHVLMSFPGIPLAGPSYPSDLGMARPALHEVLIDAARREDANLRLGLTFESLVDAGTHVDAQFTDGTQGRYDLVIGADGLHSTVRQQLFGDAGKPQFTGQGVWRYNIPRPSALTKGVMCLGLKGGKCGAMPLTESTAYVLLVQAEPGNPRHPADRLADIFRERLATCTGLFAQMRAQITDSSQVVYRPLYRVSLPPPWFKGRMLLIGDAAHATTPHLGQGAAQAVEDAVVVGELLSQSFDMPALGEAFMKRRYERCRFIAESSVQIGAWEQTDDPDADPMGLTRKMLQVVAAPI